jgi:hypothetical protein
MDDYIDDTNFQDAKEFEIELYIRELELDQEETITMTRREWIDLYYSCAQAEMMWRHRSHTPSIDSNSQYSDTPEEFEVECRAEMKKYRVLQREIGEAINF